MKKRIAVGMLALASFVSVGSGFVTHMQASVVNPLVGRRGHHGAV